MPVDLANVNISLQQFQEISSGKYNAGEVKLASATRLDKMNHHVRQRFRNDEMISHQEVIAIKEALVEALSQHGVDPEEIGKVRRELGLAPDGAPTASCTPAASSRFRASRSARSSTGTPRRSTRAAARTGIWCTSPRPGRTSIRRRRPRARKSATP